MDGGDELFPSPRESVAGAEASLDREEMSVAAAAAPPEKAARIMPSLLIPAVPGTDPGGLVERKGENGKEWGARMDRERERERERERGPEPSADHYVLNILLVFC
jgi:hypothetical protein